MQLEHANITVSSIDETIRFLSTVFPDAEVRGSGQMYWNEDRTEARGRWAHFGNDKNISTLYIGKSR